MTAKTPLMQAEFLFILLFAMQTPSPRILFIGATHGDEPIGVNALCDLSAQTDGFDWIVGNPPAYKRNTRTFEGDLNRSAPGNPHSSQYAERRAAQILATAKNYDWCVDLHGTTADSGIFVILTKITRNNLRLAARLDIPRIVFWPSISPELNGPLSEHFPCGLEIECGPKSSPEIETQLTSILEDFMRERNNVLSDEETLARLRTREHYEVEGVCRTPIEGLREFTAAEIDGATRYPLLVDQYRDQGITCYTMKKQSIDAWW